MPADCRLIKTSNLKIEESSLTGETVPVLKNENTTLKDDVPIGDMLNMAFSSTIVVNGHGEAVVTQTGMNTKVGKIANMIIQDEAPETPIQKKLSQVGKILGIVCLAICFIIFINHKSSVTTIRGFISNRCYNVKSTICSHRYFFLIIYIIQYKINFNKFINNFKYILYLYN